MLSGVFEYTVDQKGRVVFPRRFRTQLGVPFFLTGSTDGYLSAFSRERWGSLAARHRAGASSLERLIVTAAVERIPSGPAGRILIPRTLRCMAAIEPGQRAVVVGANDRVELWSIQRWRQTHLNHAGVSGAAPGPIPSPDAAAALQMSTRDLFGFPVVEVCGAFADNNRDALVLPVKELAPAAPAVVLDLRRSLGYGQALSGLYEALSQAGAGHPPVCIVTPDSAGPLEPAPLARVFRTLEDVFWWLNSR